MKNFAFRRWSPSLTLRLLLLGGSIAVLPGEGRADILCHIADPRDSALNVRTSPGGPKKDELQNERLVRIDGTEADSSGRIWAEVSGIHRADWRNWGWVYRKSLKCVDTDRFQREHPSVDILRSVGIVPQNVWDSKGDRQGRTLPISCEEIPNGWGVTLSNELFDSYRRRGFSRVAVCLGLGGNDIHFDPASGQQLKLYQIPGDIFGLRAFWLPDCFKEVRIIKKRGYLIGWRPVGCNVKYHPSTGLPIANAELVELSAGGEAGGGVDEDNRASTVSEDRARALIFGR